ncbi:hypothetical protein NCCP2165_18370 [Halomonas sp. NCCP-2165]|nr:hypothetical protein NCCP2165_18370 [Halomonas sp. NCCP-2165]
MITNEKKGSRLPAFPDTFQEETAMQAYATTLLRLSLGVMTLALLVQAGLGGGKAVLHPRLA